MTRLARTMTVSLNCHMTAITCERSADEIRLS